jgi:hypothetical protein
MTIQPDGNTSYGTAPETFTKQLDEWGATSSVLTARLDHTRCWKPSKKCAT